MALDPGKGYLGSMNDALTATYSEEESERQSNQVVALLSMSGLIVLLSVFFFRRYGRRCLAKRYSSKLEYKANDGMNLKKMKELDKAVKHRMCQLKQAGGLPEI